jgi:hypothetical protein
MTTQITLQAGQTLVVHNGDYPIDASAGNDTIFAGDGDERRRGRCNYARQWQ